MACTTSSPIPTRSPSPSPTASPSPNTPPPTHPTRPVRRPSMSESSLRRHEQRLEDFEAETDSRPAFYLNSKEAKLLGIAGVGFFLDAYDLFIINPVATMLQWRLYNGTAMPAHLEGFMKAGANIGSVIGQILFGFLADYLGRKAVYGKELLVIIIGTILCMTLPTGTLSPDACLIYLGCFRILVGIGVGGDYPMSASVVSDRSNLRKRGTMLAYIFSAQGWGSFVGGIVTIVVLACYKNVMDTHGMVSKVDGVWRIAIGVSLIPASITCYYRFTLPESTRFINSKNIGKEEEGEGEVEEGDSIELKKVTAKAKVLGDKEKASPTPPTSISTSQTPIDIFSDTVDPEKVVKEKGHFKEFLLYFSEWRHAKILIGTCACWFLLDVAFYGINLNQNIVLEQIGFIGQPTDSAWHKMFKTSTGGIIITALGFVPGYYATVLSIEWLGRKWIQVQGFLMAALFLAILAGKFTDLGTAGFIVCFAFLQFFFNFGANATTYCYPAEVFPTRFKALAHGVSAACGKAGAIISALVFNTLTKKIGTPNVLWIFFACCIMGAFFTFLLPEVKNRDPDVILAEEIKEARAKRRAAAAASAAGA